MIYFDFLTTKEVIDNLKTLAVGAGDIISSPLHALILEGVDTLAEHCVMDKENNTSDDDVMVLSNFIRFYKLSSIAHAIKVHQS